MKHLQQFGLTCDPLGKALKEYIDNDQYQRLKQRFDYLLDTKGVGMITGDTGVGKTTALRKLVDSINPHQYKVVYQVENHFRAFDIYGQLAEQLGLERSHRYCNIWRSIKKQLVHLYDDKKMTTVWILDEAQNLPTNFLSELPSFLNFNFDSKEVIVILLVGTPALRSILQRSSYASLTSRLHFHFKWEAMSDANGYAKFITQAFCSAGRSDQIISDSGMKLLHVASQGKLRQTHRILTQAMQMATAQGANHLTDEVINEAIDRLHDMML